MHHCDVEDTLKAGGLRRTAKRHRLLELFGQKRAWTVSQLHRHLNSGDLSTVYRNIQELQAKRIIDRVPLRGEEASYELASLPHHAHLLCAKCHEAECVPCPVKLRTAHNLEMSGLCSACRA